MLCYCEYVMLFAKKLDSDGSIAPTIPTNLALAMAGSVHVSPRVTLAVA